MDRKERVYEVYKHLFYEESRLMCEHGIAWGNIDNRDEIIDNIYWLADLMVTRFEVCAAKPKEGSAMKLSDLIGEIQRCISEHGDIEVWAIGYYRPGEDPVPVRPRIMIEDVEGLEGIKGIFLGD